jgi:hypothetical protein
MPVEELSAFYPVVMGSVAAPTGAPEPDREPDIEAWHDEEHYLKYTIERMIEQLVLLEDHLLAIGANRDVLQCLACSYWHVYKLIAYDYTERQKFDPDYNTAFLDWAEGVMERISTLKSAYNREAARKIAGQAREWRYYFVGDESAAPATEQSRPRKRARYYTANQWLPMAPDNPADPRDPLEFFHLEMSSGKSVRELEAMIEALEDTIKNDPARRLVKYIKRSGSRKSEFIDFTPKQFRELTGKNPVQSIISPKTGRIPWELSLDLVAPDLGFPDHEDLRDAVELCHRRMTELDELKHDLAIAREGPSCDRMMQTWETCLDPVLGDSCTGKAIRCGDELFTAIRNPSSWDIHVLRENEPPGDFTAIGKVRYAREAASAIKDLARGTS